MSWKFYLFLSLLGGDVERRVEIFGVGVHLSAGLQEEDDNVDVAEAGGDVEGRLLFLKKKQKKR